MDRRQYLRALGATGLAGLAGCGGQSTDTPAGTPTETPTDSPTEPPTDTPTATPTPSEAGTPTATPTPTGTPLPPAAAEVAVGPDGSFAFDPERVTVSVGDTVRWVWEGPGHNVKPDDVPADSDWQGTPGGAMDTFGTGHVYAHAFRVAGTFEYLCVPHRSYGMRGTVVVE